MFCVDVCTVRLSLARPSNTLPVILLGLGTRPAGWHVVMYNGGQLLVLWWSAVRPTSCAARAEREISPECDD